MVDEGGLIDPFVTVVSIHHDNRLLDHDRNVGIERRGRHGCGSLGADPLGVAPGAEDDEAEGRRLGSREVDDGVLTGERSRQIGPVEDGDLYRFGTD